MAKRRKPKLVESAAVYIDPIGSESLIGFTAIIGYMGRKHLNIKLTDCERSIAWGFHCKSHEELVLSRAKIQAAIAMFERAGRALEALHKAR